MYEFIKLLNLRPDRFVKYDPNITHPVLYITRGIFKPILQTINMGFLKP